MSATRHGTGVLHSRRTHGRPATPTPPESESEAEREHEHGHEAHGDEPWLFRLLNRAAAFADVIAQHHGHSHEQRQTVEDEGETPPDVMGILGHDLARITHPEGSHAEHALSTTVSESSSPPRRSSTWRHSAPHRWAFLSASSWLKRRRGGLGGEGEEKHQDSANDDEEAGAGVTKSPFLVSPVSSPPPTPLIRPVADTPPVTTMSPQPDMGSPDPLASASAVDLTAEPPVLTAAQKVALIIEEFGAIAAEGEEETLLAETDASFFQDVAILGVLHLTTHRLAFHASLLSARPDLSPASQVLHAGPAVVGLGHGKGAGKRVWMELSHDMITTFRSSNDYARVRPLRTVLLSAFRKIHPLDPRYPRRVTLDFETAAEEPRGKKKLSKEKRDRRAGGEKLGRKGSEKTGKEAAKQHGTKDKGKHKELSSGSKTPIRSVSLPTAQGGTNGHAERPAAHAGTNGHSERPAAHAFPMAHHAHTHPGGFVPSPAPSPRSSLSPTSFHSPASSSSHSDSDEESDASNTVEHDTVLPALSYDPSSPADPSRVTITTDTVEFDTEEAALGWRREVKAALYLYRCQRGRGAGQGEVGGAEPDQDEGVRISIPLRRLKEHQITQWENLATVLQLDLGPISIGVGEFGEGVGADFDFGTEGQENLRRAMSEATKKGNGEGGLKRVRTTDKGREKELVTAPRRVKSGLSLARSGSVKEQEEAKVPDLGEELLVTQSPLPQTRGWESPRVETSGSGARKHLHQPESTFSPARKTDHASSPPPPSQTHSSKLQFALLRSNPVWARFGELVHARSEDGVMAAGRGEVEPATIVDFGPLTFVEPGLEVDVGRGRPGRRVSGGVKGGGGDGGEGEFVKGSREREVRRIFGLGDMDIHIMKCSLTRTISTSGLLVISKRFVCFWSRLLAASDVKLRFSTLDVRAAIPLPTGMHAPPWCRGVGMALQVYGHPDVLFEFSKEEMRDEAVRRVRGVLAPRERSPSPPPGTRPGTLRTAATIPGSSPLRSTMSMPLRSSSLGMSTTASASFASTPVLTSSPTSSPPSSPPFPPSQPSVSTLAQMHPSTTALLSPPSRTVEQLRQRSVPPAVFVHLAKPINVPSQIPYGIAHRHFVVLTIGSRGDVQPYIALGLGLQRAGHTVTIVTHGEYKAWIEGWGIKHRTTGGDPGALMKLNVEHKMFSPQFFRESLTHFRTWIDELLVDAWEQCRDADVLIESPPAMAGVHIAEALNIPYFRAFTMPWSRTSQYPHPFISPPVENSARFNVASYVLFDNVFWLGTSKQINKWRKKHLGLRSTDMGHLAQAKIPFLYNFSPTVVPKPLDWGDQITITGYWFLDNPELNWTPDEALLQFIVRARAEHRPLVYIGFGSITVPHARALTRSVVKAVLKSNVRAILSKGWSSRMEKDTGPEIELPPEIHVIEAVPHDWLFPQVDAALHHGGAGTTGASLRAGIPTLIKPWFGDQFFWASRVQRLGAGLKVASLRSADLADALRKATTDRVMIERASAVGERIRQEDGISVAIQAIYTYLYRAGKDRTTLKA